MDEDYLFIPIDETLKYSPQIRMRSGEYSYKSQGFTMGEPPKREEHQIREWKKKVKKSQTNLF